MSSEILILWSAAQIGERDGMSKQAVSKTIQRMLDEKPDTPLDRDTRGRVTRVSLAHYDHFRQRFLNPAKSPPGPSVSELSVFGGLPGTASESFEEARRQAEWLKVGREKIRHQEECGQLVRRDKLDEALAQIGAALQAIIRRLPNRADEMALAVSKEGVHGARILFRKIAFELGNEMADKLMTLAETALPSDPLIEDENP